MNKIMKLSAIFIAFALVATPSAAVAATRHVTISSEGTVKITPDAVRLNAAVSLLGTTSAEALKSANATSASLRTALTTSGVDKKDIATQSISVYPDYQYSADGTSSIIGYRATQSFVVTIRKASSAGAVVDFVIASGGDNVQIQGVTPFILDATKAAVTARSAAVKSAKAKATSYATLLGARLGKVIYLVENSSPATYLPSLGTAKADSGATEVDLGQQDVTVSVTVRWSLN